MDGLRDFFMPDGDGGRMSPADAERLYLETLGSLRSRGYSGLTGRRIDEVVSTHKPYKDRFRNRVGERYPEVRGSATAVRRVVAIFEQQTEPWSVRYLVATELGEIMIIDRDKVDSVKPFAPTTQAAGVAPWL